MPTETAADLQNLRDITLAAAEIFTAEPRRRAAIAYLNQRGIDAGRLADTWVIGHAPAGWTRLVDQLRGAFDDQALLEAGLARRSSRGSLIDVFRERVLFGIRAADGTIAGFIGRDLSGDPGAPKYLNTAQTPLFDKGSLLYGLHESLEHGAAGQPVVVEGPLDVLAIAAHWRSTGHAGLLPLAPCGTALTVTQARQVVDLAQRHQSSVVVATDSDPAGRKAALDAGERIRYAGADVRVAPLPNGSDPAEYLAQPNSSVDAFRAENGHSLITLHVRDAVARQGDRMQWVEGRLAAAREITTYLATYPASHAARQIGWISDALRLDAATLTRELVDAFDRVPRRMQPASRSIGIV